MRRYLLALALLLPSCALAQRGITSGSAVPVGTALGTEVVTAAPSGACTTCIVKIVQSTGAMWCCPSCSGTWTACGATAALGLPANPAACSANQWVTDQDASGVLTCSQPAFTSISGSVTDDQVPNTITVNRTESKTISLDSPTNTEDITIWKADQAVTITRLDCVIIGGTSVTYTIRYATNRNDSGTQVTGGTIVCSSTTTGTSNTGLSVSVPSGDWVWLETTAVSGTVNNVAVTIRYTVP